MPVACRNCRAAGLTCRVHVRSGRCNECNRRNLKNCNIRISESEWSVILEEKKQLQARLESLRKEEEEVKELLRKNADRAAEAIAVEEANIALLEQQEASAWPTDGMALSPFTWSAVAGLGDEVWDAGVPEHLEDPCAGSGETAPASGGNS